MRSAYALQKTSFFVLFTNKTSFFGGIYGALFFAKKSERTDGRSLRRFPDDAAKNRDL